jgi:hypothetical protein
VETIDDMSTFVDRTNFFDQIDSMNDWEKLMMNENNVDRRSMMNSDRQADRHHHHHQHEIHRLSNENDDVNDENENEDTALV